MFACENQHPGQKTTAPAKGSLPRTRVRLPPFQPLSAFQGSIYFRDSFSRLQDIPRESAYDSITSRDPRPSVQHGVGGADGGAQPRAQGGQWASRIGNFLRFYGPVPQQLVPFQSPFFFGSEGKNPTKIDSRKKVGTLILTSLLEDLDWKRPVSG